MATLVTLNEAKAHLRVTGAQDDDLITLYNEAAYDYVARFLNLPDFMNGDSPASYPASIRAAALLLIGDMFENREAQIIGATVVENKAVMNLLYPYREEIGI